MPFRKHGWMRPFQRRTSTPKPLPPTGAIVAKPRVLWSSRLVTMTPASSHNSS